MNIPWKLKAKIYNVLTKFGLHNTLYWIQKHVTRRSREKLDKVSLNWVFHKKNIIKHGHAERLFEFGAGKSLIQNLFLSGLLREQIVVDLFHMIDLELVEFARKSLLKLGVSLKSVEKVDSIRNLSSYGIRYLAPMDASDTKLPDQSFDICVSTNTLEHIAREDIKKIVSEVYRMLKHEGYLSVVIDYSDHYSHTDRSISPLNYLQYSDKEWRKYNSSLHFQNRLRHQDYLDIFTEAGFKVIDEICIEKSASHPQKISSGSGTDSWDWLGARILLVK